MFASLFFGLWAMAADPFVEAARIDEGLRAAAPEARREWLERAAHVPWPALSADLEANLAQSIPGLSVEARRAWAGDRALAVVEGELPVGPEAMALVVDGLRQGDQRENAALEAAREAYARGLAQRSVELYGQVDRRSREWPAALREQAWAHWRADRLDHALGSSVSLAAPYFASQDRSEGKLVEAMALIAHCRFEAARELVKPILAGELQVADHGRARAWVEAGVTPEGLAAAAWEAPIVTRVRKVASLSVRGVPEAVRALEARLLFEAWRDEVAVERELRARALSIRYDALRAERALLETRSAIRPPARARLPLLGDDDVVWRFTGTYWRDELGTYRVYASDACPEPAP